MLSNFPLSGFREGGRGMGKILSAVFGQEFFLSERYVTVTQSAVAFVHGLSKVENLGIFQLLKV
jgi:hypothetical protein